MAARIYVGISGWRYSGWRGQFYPKGLPQRRELEYVSETLNSVELNGSFYSLQRPDSYQEWRRVTSDEFIFSVKGGRYITHMLRLRNIESALANFFASGVLALGSKLGPILWQFPPQMKFDSERFEPFLSQLPRTGREAAKLAQKHNDKVNGRAWLRADGVDRLRHAVEVRHPSFLCPEFIALLRAHDIALVVADTAKKFIFAEDITADFVHTLARR